MADWNPQAYLTFADERLRPAQDLLARVPAGERNLITDLGSGPGNSTALLRNAYPAARLTGVETSPAMIAKAQGVVPDATFLRADAADFMPDADTDLVFSNALFQWVPGHLAVFKRLLQGLKPGAALAVQMPDNLAEPSHAMMRRVAASPDFGKKLRDAETVRERILSPQAYAENMHTLCARFDVWLTRYHHVVQGHDGIADFFASTGLKTYLDRLSADEQMAFRKAYVEELAKAYHALPDGRVMFAVPRLFLVAVR